MLVKLRVEEVRVAHLCVLTDLCDASLGEVIVAELQPDEVRMEIDEAADGRDLPIVGPF